MANHLKTIFKIAHYTAPDDFFLTLNYWGTEREALEAMRYFQKSNPGAEFSVKKYVEVGRDN